MVANQITANYLTALVIIVATILLHHVAKPCQISSFPRTHSDQVDLCKNILDKSQATLNELPSLLEKVNAVSWLKNLIEGGQNSTLEKLHSAFEVLVANANFTLIPSPKASPTSSSTEATTTVPEYQASTLASSQASTRLSKNPTTPDFVVADFVRRTGESEYQISYSENSLDAFSQPGKDHKLDSFMVKLEVMSSTDLPTNPQRPRKTVSRIPGSVVSYDFDSETFGGVSAEWRSFEHPKRKKSIDQLEETSASIVAEPETKPTSIPATTTEITTRQASTSTAATTTISTTTTTVTSTTSEMTTTMAATRTTSSSSTTTVTSPTTSITAAKTTLPTTPISSSATKSITEPLHNLVTTTWDEESEETVQPFLVLSTTLKRKRARSSTRRRKEKKTTTKKRKLKTTHPSTPSTTMTTTTSTTTTATSSPFSTTHTFPTPVYLYPTTTIGEDSRDESESDDEYVDGILEAAITEEPNTSIALESRVSSADMPSTTTRSTTSTTLTTKLKTSTVATIKTSTRWQPAPWMTMQEDHHIFPNEFLAATKSPSARKKLPSLSGAKIVREKVVLDTRGYFLVENVGDYRSARDACASRHGRLAIIKSSHDFAAIVSFNVELGWIGLFRSKQTERGFVWNDGSVFNSSQFDPNPSFVNFMTKSSPLRDCVAFWKDLSWRTFPCNQSSWRNRPMKAVCQYERNILCHSKRSDKTFCVSINEATEENCRFMSYKPKNEADCLFQIGDGRQQCWKGDSCLCLDSFNKKICTKSWQKNHWSTRTECQAQCKLFSSLLPKPVQPVAIAKPMATARKETEQTDSFHSKAKNVMGVVVVLAAAGGGAAAGVKYLH